METKEERDECPSLAPPHPLVTNDRVAEVDLLVRFEMLFLTACLVSLVYPFFFISLDVVGVEKRKKNGILFLVG